MNRVLKAKGVIKATSGAFEALDANGKRRVKVWVNDIKWFLKQGSDLSAYRIISPQRIQRKNNDTIVAIWSRLNSKERATLKKVAEELKKEKYSEQF